ncbi:MAG TPA: class I SAM-dependent methyltransferase [Planctomycetota bacterium]|nr:class I SAM-dependent methyltransferase [Planctomycetota bacterium]
MSRKGAEEVERLPFDQYQRYRLVSDLLADLDGGARELEVLDVGGRTALLRRFLPGRRITLVDLEPSAERGLVLGDGAALPFRDGAFDLVAAFDTLEHVPPASRERFVAECARVARRWVVLAGPYEAPEVAEAERLLQRFLREKLESEHRYLEEHRTHGLPRREAVEAQLEQLDARVKSFGHANLERWLALMCMSLYMDDDPSLRPLAGAFHAFYNRSLYDSDHAEPVYRHAVVAAFRGAKLPEGRWLAAPAVAPRGALAEVLGLASELVAFDREREAWRSEREALRKVAADLEQDVAGHRAALREAHAELDRKGRGIAELEREMERERGEGRAAISALEADLAEHGRALAVLEADLAAHRTSLEGLRGELASTLAAAQAIQDELRATNAAAAAVNLTLGERERELERLRAELRSRWRNLKRALRLRKPPPG